MKRTICIAICTLSYLTYVYAQDLSEPALSYTIEVSQDGQIIILDTDGNVVERRESEAGVRSLDNNFTSGSDMLPRPNDEIPIVQGPMPNLNDAWVVIDRNGIPTAVGPAGSTSVLNALGEGDALQVVQGWGTNGIDASLNYNFALFGRRPSLEEMQSSIEQQMRAAVEKLQTEACVSMRNWQSVTVRFELGASAFVSARIIGEGTFVPSEVCPQ
jgi:hypothetical protein